MTPHVGLNLVYLVPGEVGGMEVVARELIPALLEERPDLRLTAFVNREAAEVGGGPWTELIPSVIVPGRARNRVEWVRGEQQHLPRLARQAGVDLVHSLASTAPLRGRFARVTTIHDLIYKVHPEAHEGIRTLGMRVLLPLAARRSHRVIVDSANTRDDVVDHFGVAPAKVDVVHLGLGTTPSTDPLPEGDVRERHRLGERPLLLSVSAKRPHKNLMRLLEALALIPRERRPVLVVPGYATWHEDELRRRASELDVQDDVRWPAWVDAAELEGLYRTAAAFVFPSLYEGFGMPVLEAMRRGVPVASSDRSCLPEVAGDAALYFDAEDPAAMARTIESILSNSGLAARLREAGEKRVEMFTWRNTARGTLDSYERALATLRRP